MYEGSTSYMKDKDSDINKRSANSFEKSKTEANIKSELYASEFLSKDRSNSPSKLPKGAQRVKPEGSRCIHRKGGTLTPADLECTFKPIINKKSRIIDNRLQQQAISPSRVKQRHDRLINQVSC